MYYGLERFDKFKFLLIDENFSSLIKKSNFLNIPISVVNKNHSPILALAFCQSNFRKNMKLAFLVYLFVYKLLSAGIRL
jgi:hypothetical protein